MHNTAMKLLAILLCIAVAINAQESEDTEIEAPIVSYRLPPTMKPLHYDVRIVPRVDERNSTTTGEVSIHLQIWNCVKEIVLHSKDIRIFQSLTTLESEDRVIFRPEGHHYDRDTQMLRLPFKYQLGPGIYVLNLTFATILSDDLYGCYNNFYTNENDTKDWMLLTHLQPIYARRVFPCFDEPALKATFKISLKHPSSHTALSNMPKFEEEVDVGDGLTWTHFQTTPLMSTNIIAFTLINYDVISNADGTTKLWTTTENIPYVRYALDVIESATSLFKSYLNSTMVMPKTDHVTVKHYSSRATENWGLILYAERALRFNPETDLLLIKLYNQMTIVHELAHEWFGNLVSPSWWKYLWMSEGMATYLKYLIADKIDSSWRLMEQYVVRELQHGGFGMDLDDGVSTINADVESPRELTRRQASIVYTKSAIILRMLSHIVSEEVFRAGLIKYIEANKFSSVTSDDLWKAMQEALEESGNYSDEFKVKDVMDTWIEQRGFPIVVATRNYTTSTVNIDQVSVNAEFDINWMKWWVPITYATTTEPNFNNTTPSHWLIPGEAHLTIENIDDNDWFIANIQQTGYYRVSYDDENWRKIAKFLNCDDYTKIHVLNRAQIIDDVKYFTLHRQLDPNIFIDVVNYLGREVDYIPWYSMLNTLSNVPRYLVFPEAQLLRMYILHLMDNIVQHVGFEDRPEDNDYQRMVRGEILLTACKLGHPDCIQKANEKLIAHLDNPEENKVTPDLERWTYCMGLKDANQETWNRVLEEHNDRLNPRMIEYLGCSENPGIIDNYLAMSIDNETNVSKDFGGLVVYSVDYDNPMHVDRVINFVTTNWDTELHKWFNPNFVLDMLGWRLHTENHYQKLKWFMDKKGIPISSNMVRRRRTVSALRERVVRLTNLLSNHSIAHGQDAFSLVTYTCPN